MTFTQSAVDIVKRFEGCRLKAYLCPAGKPTIGYGSTENVQLGMEITQAEANDRLRKDMQAAADGVSKYCKTKLSQNQFDALVSFTYNIGVGRFAGSTLLRLLNSGDLSGAAAQFPRWNKADGKTLPGLVTRRAAEQALFNAAESSQPST